MKVCHFVASVGLGRGDAFVDLANAESEKAEIYVVAPKGAKFGGSLGEKVQLVEYQSSNRRFNPWLYWELYCLFKRIDPNIVHTHFAKASEVFNFLNKTLYIPHVATKHNPRKGNIFNRLRNVVAVSEGVARSIRHENVEIIYNGICPEKVVNHGPNKIFVMCAVGRLDKIKGFDVLLDEVAKIDEPYILNIVGDGEERVPLEGKIVDLELQEKVKLLGFRTDVPEILATSDLQVMSSRSEGFSLAMVEAIFYSKVFLSTRVAGCEEILPDELIMEDVEIGDKIKDVMRNYGRYVTLFGKVKNSFQKRLDIREVSTQYIDYYKRILRAGMKI